MTLYEELYYQLLDYPKFYRFEGAKSFNHFSFEKGEILPNVDIYVYFSASSKHHFYYAAKRLKQLIDKEILYETKYAITKRTIVNSEKFQGIVNKIENTFLEEKLFSVECIVSPLMRQLITNNCIKNSLKEHGDYRIERVDNRQSGGGYGFYGEWLEVFKTLTYIHTYYKITKEDLIKFVYAFRQKIINPNFKISIVSFLADPHKRIITLNDNLQNDFSKYELMNALQGILEKELYFPSSYLGMNEEDGIKKIMQDYTLEREYLLTLLEENYERKLNL